MQVQKEGLLQPPCVRPSSPSGHQECPSTVPHSQHQCRNHPPPSRKTLKSREGSSVLRPHGTEVGKRGWNARCGWFQGPAHSYLPRSLSWHDTRAPSPGKTCDRYQVEHTVTAKRTVRPARQTATLGETPNGGWGTPSVADIPANKQAVSSPGCPGPEAARQEGPLRCSSRGNVPPTQPREGVGSPTSEGCRMRHTPPPPESTQQSRLAEPLPVPSWGARAPGRLLGSPEDVGARRLPLGRIGGRISRAEPS